MTDAGIELNRCCIRCSTRLWTEAGEHRRLRQGRARMEAARGNVVVGLAIEHPFEFPRRQLQLVGQLTQPIRSAHFAYQTRNAPTITCIPGQLHIMETIEDPEVRTLVREHSPHLAVW